MNRFPKLLATVSACLVVVGSLAGCGGPSGSATTAAPLDASKANLPKSADDINGNTDTSKVKKDLVVGVDNPYYLFHEDIEVAAANGYFKEFGINSVDIKTVDDPLPPLIGGSLDLMLYDTDTTIAAARKSNGDLRFLSVYLGGEANILGVAPGINTAEDLKGKTITGGQFGSRNDAILRELLQANGMDPAKDVQIVSTGGQSETRFQALLAGTVQGASIQLRHELLLQQAGGKVLFKQTRDVPQVGWSADRLLRESPETAPAFLAATLKARQFITNQANKATVLALMRGKKYNIPPAYEDVYPQENSTTYHVADGGFKPADMDKFIADQIGFKNVPPGTDWHQYTYLVPLWRAQKALGLPLDPALQGL